MSQKYLGGYLADTTSFTTPASGDPQFNYVTALLHGDGTNGAQNNTFLDSSSNAFTITRNGNTTQGSFSPFGSLWSNYFVRASSQYLTVSNSGGQFSFGTGAFTIECWVNLASMPSGNGYPASYWLFGSGPPNSDAGVEFYINNTQIGFNLTAFSSPTAIGNHGISVGGWYHVAVIRGGTSNQTLSIYVNGSRVATASSVTATADAASTGIAISAAEPSGATSGNFDGYISNYRVVKGTAVYDPTQTTLTVPTSPLTAITNTQLLTCQSNRFIDNSTNAFAITVNGSPTVQRFSPFNTSTAYSTSVIGGSGYFDGSGDYLNITGANCALTGDFTVESWVYPTAWGAYQRIVSGGSSTFYWSLGFSTTWGGGLLINWYDGSDYYSSSYSPGTPLNTWYHVAVVRTGSTLYYYINGTRFGTSAYSSTPGNSSGGLTIGRRVGATEPWYGYMTDTRVVLGTNIYGTGSTCTVPTTPLTAVSGTSVLTNYTNAGIYDNAEMYNWETVGSIQINTTTYKYGTGSIYDNGSSSYLYIPSFTLSGSWTVEGWFYLTYVATNSVHIISTTSSVPTFIGGPNGSNMGIYLSGGYISSGVAFPLNTWSHIAAVNNNGTVTLYLNGTAICSASGYGSFTYSGDLVIGSYFGRQAGYYDDIRITKGYARYTSNFTPPTAAFPNNYTPATSTSIVPTASAAPGIWTIEQQAFYKAQSLWPTPPPVYVTYLVVAGGGGGGRESYNSGQGGGGGAGGLLTSTFAISVGVTYTVTVGAGGTLVSSGSVGNNGTVSSISGTGLTTISSTGGGGGGGGSGGGNVAVGNGGSGGGGCSTSGSTANGGTGVSGQGYEGSSFTVFFPYYSAGGGGGASQPGQKTNYAGNGGAGIASSITGTSVYYAGGGGGSTYEVYSDQGQYQAYGGLGGGGNGALYNVSNGASGTTNTGGGGGGGGNGGGFLNSGAGGSGVVIISSPQAAVSTTGSPTVTTSGGNTIYKFTSSGTITF